MTIGVGDVAPDFSLAGTGGKTYSLAQYRGAARSEEHTSEL